MLRDALLLLGVLLSRIFGPISCWNESESSSHIKTLRNQSRFQLELNLTSNCDTIKHARQQAVSAYYENGKWLVAQRCDEIDLKCRHAHLPCALFAQCQSEFWYQIVTEREICEEIPAECYSNQESFGTSSQPPDNTEVCLASLCLHNCCFLLSTDGSCDYDEQLVSDEVLEPSVDTTSLLTGLIIISIAFVLLIAILVVCQCHTYRCHLNVSQYHRYRDGNDPEITSIVSSNITSAVSEEVQLSHSVSSSFREVLDSIGGNGNSDTNCTGVNA